ncbi:MAG TPA: ATP synthase F1 subunit epsilon [Polyangiaceae bacterium]|jgi:F-type H+-transporting ATPase subunit epsilon
MATELRPDKILLEIVTPKGRALLVSTDEVTAPSVEGEFGVMPGHLPLLAALRTGIVSYRIGADVKKVAVGPGFAEAGPEKVSILTDEYIERDHIDPVLVRKELQEVQAKIAAFDAKPADEAEEEGREALVHRENWLAAQLELYGDPPPATMRPFETFGPPEPPDEADVPLPHDGAN